LLPAPVCCLLCCLLVFAWARTLSPDAESCMTVVSRPLRAQWRDSARPTHPTDHLVVNLARCWTCCPTSCPRCCPRSCKRFMSSDLSLCGLWRP
jgi:hypothetical protein